MMFRPRMLCLLVALAGALVPPLGAAMEDPPFTKAFARMMRGDRDGLDVFLEHPGPALPFLLSRTTVKHARARATALDALVHVDLADDGAVDTPSVVSALAARVAPAETDDVVVDEALRGLELADAALAPEGLDEHLLVRAKAGWTRAVLVLGRVADASWIERLRPFLSASDPAMAVAARMALAKLGDAEQLDAILAELAVDGPVRNRAFEKLAYVGDPRTAAAVAVWLDHPGRPESPDRDVGHAPYRFMAAWALQSIVPEPPVRLTRGGGSDSEVAIWRAWWAEHRDAFPAR